MALLPQPITARPPAPRPNSASASCGCSRRSSG